MAARPITLTVILVLMSVSTFKTTVILSVIFKEVLVALYCELPFLKSPECYIIICCSVLVLTKNVSVLNKQEFLLKYKKKELLLALKFIVNIPPA